MSPSKSRSARQVAVSYFEAVAARDVDAMMEHWKPGGMGHIHGMAELRAPDEYSRYFRDLFAAFPDFAFEILDVVAYGDKAAVRWGAKGTFSGPVKFEGLKATGARINIEGCDVLTIANGLIEENNAYLNATEMARQIGAVPPAGSIADRGLMGAVNLRTSVVSAIRERRGR